MPTRWAGTATKRARRIAIKLNSNQDRPGAWRRGAGMPSPQVVYALVNQLITVAGVPGEDITLFDASRYIGDPIFNRIKANPDPNFQAVEIRSEPAHGRQRARIEAFAGQGQSPGVLAEGRAYGPGAAVRDLVEVHHQRGALPGRTA